MKKIFLTVSFLLAVVVLNSQSLEDIVSKYTVANKFDKIGNIQTIKISAKTSMMGMNMPTELWMKNPNKIKTVTNINGQEIIQAFDGEKGYTISPMTGSTEPVEMTAEQLKGVVRNNMFNNFMAEYLKNGKLTLEGEDNVNGKPAFKVKTSLDGGNSSTVFIDKSTYFIIKTIGTINQGGMVMTLESFPSDYTEISGILVPMKTTISTNGMEMVNTISKVEVDIPIEDSVFKIK
jgi:hypothetical protein